MDSAGWEKVLVGALALSSVMLGAGFLLGRATAPVPLPTLGNGDGGAPATPVDSVPEPFGGGVVEGVVRFDGKPPEMKVPRKRKDAELCKDKAVPYNAVLVADGKLQDVLVRLSDDSVKGEYQPPRVHAVVDQVDCMYEPRVLGVVAGQIVDVRNRDQTLHNIHSYRNGESWFNKPQIKGGDPIAKEMPDWPSIVTLGCDVHPWMHAFVVVSHHPFFSVTGADGRFLLTRVPAGRYTLEAWHSRYGRKVQRIEVAEGRGVTAHFDYDGNEPEPPENQNEMKDLF